MKKISCIILLTFLFSIESKAQKDTVIIPEEEDFSKYADVVEAPTKRYCTSKILGISPSKLISVGYDFQAANVLTSGALESYGEEYAKINSNHGLRVFANFPVISNVKWLVNLGVNYLENKYEFQEPASFKHPLNRTLQQKGLKSYGLNLTLFRPINEKYFTIVQTSGDINGDLAIGDAPAMNQLKISASAIYGKKYHDRLMAGFGISRTYRGGGLLYIPIFMYNYTEPNKKWGLEILLPARANFRYTFNARNMLFAGFELEGNSYRLNNLAANYPDLVNRNIELRRSELRPRITYEFSVYNFIWISVQAGYRINFRYNLDEGDFYRSSFGEEIPYLAENKLTNPFYFNVSLNLVSP